MMDYKQENQKAYNSYPLEFDSKFTMHFENNIKKFADEYMGMLKGKKILDLGCGSGAHVKYFQEKGFDVICFDSSKEMLRLCKKKSLKTIEGDIENITLPSESFDGIWAYASLLHVPKSKIFSVLENMDRILKQGGIIELAVKEGEGEKMEENEKYPKTVRLFSYYTESELTDILIKKFQVLKFWKAGYGKTSFLHFILLKCTKQQL